MKRAHECKHKWDTETYADVDFCVKCGKIRRVKGAPTAPAPHIGLDY